MTARLPRLATILAAAALTLAVARGAAAQSTFPLTLHLSGTTSGRVSVMGSGGGALCDYTGGVTPCVVQITSGASVRVAANAPAGQQPGLFSSGTGPAAACGFSGCTFTMTAAADLNVAWAAGNGTIATLTTTLIGDGKGTVSPDNSRCQNVDPPQGSACQTTYLVGTPVSLGATAAPASRFSGYSAGTSGAGGCGTNAQCDFTITGNASLTATFSAITALAVTPVSAQKAAGQSQTFVASGTFSDGVTEALLPGMGAWYTQAALNSNRFSLAATATGTRVYAVGGIIGGAPGSTLSEYNPATNIWTSRAAMPTPREGVAAVTVGGFIYAVGGNTTGSVPVATVERYDPSTDTWSARAPMSAARRFLAAAAVNGIIYAVGGETVSGTPLSTLEAYDPSTDTWTTKASMPTARSFLAAGAIDGVLYVAGGTNSGGSLATLEAYDPVANTWSAKASLPGQLGATAAAVSEGQLYVMGGSTGKNSVYGYDPAQNLWSNKLFMPTGRGELAAAALNGIVYAIGGLTGSNNTTTTNKVESFVDSLRWSSGDSSIARITQQGVANAIAAGTASIHASLGGFGCGSSCGSLTVFTSVPTDMALESPVNNSTQQVNANFTISGWAVNRGAPAGTGVDAVHVYAVGASGPAIFLGAATYGVARADIGALYGSQFTNSGFTLSAGSSLPAGSYTIWAYAHDALTGTFDALKSANVLLKVPVSNGLMAIDAPAPAAIVTSSFEVGGWALDRGAFTGTGVDAVQFYVYPNDGASPGVFVGQGSYGIARSDLAAIYGSQFTNCGYHFTISGLGPGQYMLGVFAHSTITGSYSIVRNVHFTVNATALMSIDVPSPEATVSDATFAVAGWSIDRSIEGTALSGVGVDALHIYAYPNPGSGQPPIFLGVATQGISRPDVAGAYGSRYDASGYLLMVDRAALGLAPGVYSIAVASHSAVSATFNNIAVVRVALP